MKYSLPTFYLLLQCSHAYRPPAPINVAVISRDFHHILRWDPAPDTPPGTTYSMRRCHPTDPETCKPVKNPLILKPEIEYNLYVWAKFNHTASEKIKTVFTPYTDTVISPPKFALTGCGDCLLLEISPQLLPDNRLDGLFQNKTIQQFYGAPYSISWKKAGHSKIIETETSELKYKLNNLEPGVEYCVQVHLLITVNPRTLPSEWECAFTSNVTLSQVPALLSGVSALLLLVIVTLLVVGFGLVYTGSLGKLKARLPRALLTSLVQYYILTPERTIPDLVSIQSQEPVKGVRTKRDPSRTDLDLTSSEEEEEEDDSNHGYMDRPVEFCSDANSGKESQGASGGEVARDSGGSEVEAEEGTASVSGAALRSFPQTEVKDYSVRVSLCLEDLAPTSQQEMEGKEREGGALEEQEVSGDVNLFSVTLGTAVKEEDEEEEEINQATSFVDDLLSKQQVLLSDVRRHASEDVDMGSQNEMQTDCRWSYSEYDRRDTHSGYLASHTSRIQPGSEEEEEEEEEEDCSGYMGR